MNFSKFALLARIAAFALFHRETIHVPWSTAFIKAVFGFPITPKDLESVNPDLYEAKVVYLRDSVSREIEDEDERARENRGGGAAFSQPQTDG